MICILRNVEFKVNQVAIDISHDIFLGCKLPVLVLNVTSIPENGGTFVVNCKHTVRYVLVTAVQSIMMLKYSEIQQLKKDTK